MRSPLATEEIVDYFRAKHARAEYMLKCIAPTIDPYASPAAEFPPHLETLIYRVRMTKRELEDIELIHEAWKSYEDIPIKPYSYIIVLFTRAHRELNRLGIEVPEGDTNKLLYVLESGDHLPEVSRELREIYKNDAERAKRREELISMLGSRIHYHKVVLDDEKRSFISYVLEHEHQMRAYFKFGNPASWPEKMVRHLELDKSCSYKYRTLLIERIRELELASNLFSSLLM
jgi:hypothetical protein